mmetsp:Transcript_10145/g.17653  ORF Transcript_10145/g.17653 Transcript_10145/m.17653 type:complete len:246 (+) Transcript_10145:1-738(+)
MAVNLVTGAWLRRLHRRIGARDVAWTVVVALVALALFALRRSEKQRARRLVSDPIFATWGVVYSSTRLAESWEDFLDAFKFPKASPIRQHIRQLFSRADFDEQLEGLFDTLCRGPAMTRSQFERFSRGLHGHVNILTDKKTKIKLLSPTPEDVRWMANCFDTIFPEEQPMTRDSFKNVAKLVLVRRVVRTLIEFVGVEQIQAGMAAPLVVDIAVDLGDAVFRFHTVAPISKPSLESGERLNAISE